MKKINVLNEMTKDFEQTADELTTNSKVNYFETSIEPYLKEKGIEDFDFSNY